MTRPPFEVADIIREHGDRFIETHGAWLTAQHHRVLRAIARCRTAALGGHLDRCAHCAHRAISYNSCRNRHCPKCLTHARDQWLVERERELLPVGYHHVVFTVPHELSWLALQNKQVVYDLLFRASAATLLEVAADAKHLGAAVGCLSVLHTWGQNLLHHPHVHCVIPVGGLSPDRTRWVHPRYPFFLPVKVLSRVFRGKFVAGLRQAFRLGRLSFPARLHPHKLPAKAGLRQAFRLGRLSFPARLHPLTEAPAFRTFLRRLFRHDWVVYAKPPFGGPAHVLQYLARYTHRVVISNHRILNVSDDTITFQWKDYRHGSQSRTMTVSAVEFLRRFFLHVLPKGFVRIRFFGFLAHRRRARDLPVCRHALATHQPVGTTHRKQTAPSASWPCPRCGGTMVVIERLMAHQIWSRAVMEGIVLDSS